MATATKQKISKADMDKDVQSLMELQDKLNMHAGLNQMVGHAIWTAGRAASDPQLLSPVAVAVLQVVQQIQRAKIQQRRAELALSQLSDLPGDVSTYKQVGKA